MDKDTKKKINKKGISGVDIAIAVVVISIGLSLIIALIFEINTTTKKVQREIGATQIAKSIFEKMKLLSYDQYLEAVKYVSNTKYKEHFDLGDIDPGYTIEITVEDKTPSNLTEAILFNIRKEGEIKVKYSVNKKEELFKIPYVKYFDRVTPMNEPDLNSTAIQSANSYLDSSKYEPGYGSPTNFILADDINLWKKNGLRESFASPKLARRKNTTGVYDYFNWIPRATVDSTNTYRHLIGISMQSLDPIIKNITYPVGTNIQIIITRLSNPPHTTTPNSGNQEGIWVYTT